MTPLRRELSIILAGAACACGGEMPERENLGVRRVHIVGGTLDTGDPAVVGLADSTGFVDCTGTLVDSTHVVTAAHCLYNYRGSRVTPTYVFVCNDSTVVTPSTKPSCFARTSGSVTHPLFRLSSADLAHDIGVVTLMAPSSIAPARLPTGRMLSSSVGTDVRNVGFGINDVPSDSGDGVKREGLSRLTYIGPRSAGTAPPNPDGLTSGQLQMTETPAGTCFGDSGGPAFWPANQPSEAVVGITSWGDDFCASYGVDTMVGAYLCWLQSAGIAAAYCPSDGGTPPPPDAGMPPDAGSGADAGTPAVDAGSGKPDAGVSQAGPRGGASGGPPGFEPPADGGCGCGPQAQAPIAILGAIAARAMRRKRR